MPTTGIDQTSFLTSGLAPHLAWPEAREVSPLERPTYFWAGLMPFVLVAVFLILQGERFYAGVVVGVYLIGVTFLVPQVGIYAAFCIQAWDPYFVDPSRQLPILGVVTPTKVLSLVLVAAILITPRRRRFALTVTRRTFVWGSVFTVMAFLLALAAPEPLIALRYAGQIAVLAIITYAATTLIRTREQVHRLVNWTIVGAVTASAAFYLLGDPSRRARGTFGEFSNANTTAMTLCIGMMCIPAAWGLTRTRLAWLFHAPAAAFIMTTIMMTGSRGASVSVVVAYSIGGVLTRGRGAAKKVLAAVFATAFGTGVFFAVLNAGILGEKSQDRLEAFVLSGERTSMGYSRFYIWSNALITYTHHPFVGVGIGNASKSMAQVLYGRSRDVHNDYLSVLVETGVVGAVLFFAFLASLALRVWRIPYANPGVPTTILFLYILLSGMTHTTYYTKMFWMPLAVVFVLTEYGHSRYAPRAKARAAANTSAPMLSGRIHA